MTLRRYAALATSEQADTRTAAIAAGGCDMARPRVSKELSSKWMSTRVTPEQAARFQELCAERGETMTDALRGFVLRTIAKAEKQGGSR